MEVTITSSQQYTNQMSQCSTQSQQEQHSSGTLRRNFHVLYTKHKTQKRKIWQDGRLAVQSHAAVTLHSANPPPGAGDPVLDTCALSSSEIQALRQGTLSHLETEKFLVQVDGPWQGCGGVPPSWSSGSDSSCNTSKTAPSAAMQNLMQRKFRKPAVKRPPPVLQPPTFLHQRKRPLQPGELHRTYYGPSSGQQHQVSHQTPSIYEHRETMYSRPHESTAIHPPDRQHQPSFHPSFDSQRSASGYPNVENRQQPIPQHQHQSRFYDTRAPQSSGQSQNASPPSRTAPSPPPLISGNCATPIQNHPATSSSQLSSYAHSIPAQSSGPSSICQGWDNSNAVVSRVAPARKAGDFISNSFDPKGFYGEDGEEEEEESPDHMGTLLCESSNSALRRNDENAVPDALANRAPVEETKADDIDQNKALTTEDLLELFGGESTQAESTTKPFVKTTLDASIEDNDDFVLPPPSDSSDDEDE